MIPTLYKIHGPWPGKLFVSARPRGGDWLSDEVAAWKHYGIDTIVSLLTPQEEVDLDITDEASLAAGSRMTFVSLPVEDRGVPASRKSFLDTLDSVDQDLTNGHSVLIHCRQGIGRSGLAAGSLLIRHGVEPVAAMNALSTARGVDVPETTAQREWLTKLGLDLAA